jgi:hypothetical protein
MAMLRYEFALEHQAALTVIGRIPPEKQVLLAEKVWEVVVNSCIPRCHTIAVVLE